jgi:phosphoribosylglycinamide formyltransferase-1
MTHIAIFASGSGSNARRLMAHFRDHPDARIALLVCNKPDAGALRHAYEMGVPAYLINRQGLTDSRLLIDVLRLHAVGFIALAGFLWRIPPGLVAAFPEKMVNIHPSLLPAHGGKGMYGQHVHEAVLRAGEAETGITIHRVNEHYDEGDIVFQARCPVLPSDTAADIALRVQQLEHEHYPVVLEQLIGSVALS